MRNDDEGATRSPWPSTCLLQSCDLNKAMYGRATPVLRSKLRGNPDLTSEGNPPNTKQLSLNESNQRGEREAKG